MDTVIHNQIVNFIWGMIEKDLVEAIIALPEKMFYYQTG